MARGGFFAVDSLASVHVLLVDDDSAFRDALVSLLRYCGALVIAVATAEEALLSMDQVKPDAVVITIGGRCSSGESLPRRVRARKPEDGGVVPIVALTRGRDRDVTPEGVTAHLAEPLNPWELCRVISTLLTIG
jgi:CheY-like chemotaxis protein